MEKKERGKEKGKRRRGGMKGMKKNVEEGGKGKREVKGVKKLLARSYQILSNNKLNG